LKSKVSVFGAVSMAMFIYCTDKSVSDQIDGSVGLKGLHLNK